MDKLVVFNLGEGDFQRGFPVTLQVWEEGGFLTSFVGKLPASAIDSLYDKWQSDYRQKISGRMIPTPGRVSNYSDTDLTGNSHILKAELNNWLNSETFRPVRDKFLTTVKSKHTVRVIIQTENPQLRRLPWYLWDLFERYRFAEMALSSPTFERLEKSAQPKPKVRILAILGDSSPPDPQTGIRLDINADKQFLEDLPDAETVFLVEPKRHEFNEQLWDERGWDILFFAGHSTSESDGTTGKIYINSKEYLTIDDLKPALHKAIQRGLQLAIFNSCDGLGIARDLAELQIPQIIAMREPVADLVAKEFLKYFLDSFSKGQHLYLAVREARERLHGLEKDFPCASWLPVICQNPAENPVTWQGLRGVEAGINWRDACLRTIPERGKLTSNSLVVNDGLNLNVDDVYVPLGLVERKQKDKRDKEFIPEKGSQLYGSETQYEVTKTFKNDEFFGEVLKQGKTDKSKGKRIAIIGEPGAGKTTLLQTIADWVLAETEVVPIWVSLADLGKFSLEDYLLQKWLKIALNVADVTAQMRQDLVMLFNNHQVWLLLDAADEMSAGNPLDEIKSQLRGWIAEARVVLTCRYNVWDAGKNALADFDVYRNLDFDEEEQIPLFIRSVFRNSDLGEKLCAKLAELENTRLRDTVKNPLRLTLLCLAWHIRQGDFTTKTQADLYAQFSEALYEWKREQFPTTSQQRRELNKALAALALRGMEEKESRFRLRQGWVREVLGEADEPLCELALQLGWINRVGVAAERPEEQVYAFYHPTFQEYFAALGVDDWGYFLRHVPDNPGLGIYRIFEKQWKQVILLWFGREDVEKEKKEEFIDGLVELQDGCGNFYKYQAYFLAAAGIAEFKTCKRSQEILAQIVYWAYGYFNAGKDRWVMFSQPIEEGAEAVLAEIDRQRAIARVIQLLDENSDEYTRKIVAKFLGNIAVSNEGAIARLIQLLDETSDEYTRWGVAESLGNIAVGNESAIARLIQFLDETSDQDTSSIVAHNLGKIAVGNERAIAHLIQLLDETSSEYTRRDIAEIFSKIAVKNEGAIARLIQLLDETSSEYTRWIIAKSLSNIAVGNEGVIARLIQLLDETSDQYIRRDFAEIFGKIAVKNEGAIVRLIQLLDETSSEFTRRIVAEIFGKIAVKNEEAIVRLIQLLDETSSEYTRLRVAEIFGKIAVKNEGVIVRLIQLLDKTSSEFTRRIVAKIFGKIAVKNEGAIARLIQLLDETSSEYTRLRVAEIFGKIAVKNEGAIARSIQLLDETSDEYTRGRVAESLGKIAVKNENAIARLIQLLDETSDEDTRKTVAESLGKIAVKNENAIARLIQLLDETLDKYTHDIVMESLGKIAVRNEEKIANLIQLLDQVSSDFIRRRIAKELGEIAVGNENEVVIASLIRLLDETSSESTRQIIAESLGTIAVGSKRAIARLIQLLDETSSESTRRRVAQSLGEIAVGNESAISRLIQLLDETSDANFIPILDETSDKDTRGIVVAILGNITVGNEWKIARLIQLLNETSDKYTTRRVAETLGEIIATKQQDLQVFLALKFNLKYEIYKNKFYIYEQSYELLWQCAQNLTYREFYTEWNHQFRNSNESILDTVIICPFCTYHTPKGREFCYMCGYDLATNWIAVDNTITCPVCSYKNSEGSEFCDVCGNELGVTLPTQTLNDTIICPDCSYGNPKGNEFCDACGDELLVIVSYNFEDILDPLILSLENQITPNFSQLQPTPQTYPLPINIQSLTDETDINAICQELCTQIYYLALPDTDIPTANNFAELKRHILTAKRQLQKRHLALILHECTPHPTLITCCRKIADANLGLHILWITDTPLDAPLRGFPPQQPNLLGAIQTWINELN